MNNMMNKLKNNKRGFTLIELIVVVAIIGILVLIAAPRFTGFTKDAKVATMQADVKTLSNSALVYNIENDTSWPVADPATASHTLTVGADTTDLYPINTKDATFTDMVKSTSNGYDSYLIAIDGKYEGEVFSIKGEEDRAGTKHFGTNFVESGKEEGSQVGVTIAPK